MQTKQLTDKQEMFCYEYLIDFNAKNAAIRAGYSTASASVTGSRNLSDVAVGLRLQELIDERKARVMASSDYVLQRLIEIDKLDIADIVDEQGNILPIKQWTQSWRLSIAAIDIAETKTANALVKKIKIPDKLKNLELLGKHVNVLAFKERAESKDTDSRALVVNVTTPQAKSDLEALKAYLAEE